MKTEIINSSVVIIEFSHEKKDEDSDCRSYVHSWMPQIEISKRCYYRIFKGDKRQ